MTDSIKKHTVIEYYHIQSDHMFATPEYSHSEIVETSDNEDLINYIEAKSDPWGHPFRHHEELRHGFNYTSHAGGVKVHEYVPPTIKNINMSNNTKRKISCEIVADSIDGRGNRITSAIFTFPRYILAELNTHRVLTKNSASSRAIPFKKMLKSVMDDPFVPMAWQKDHTGMQGTEYFTDELFEPIKLSDYRSEIKMTEVLESEWLTARNYAVTASETLSTFGLTKQICNRILEPFLWHRVLITGTEWDNFFALRAHPDADIHIAKLAEETLIAFNESTPELLQPGEWHMPFGDQFDEIKLAKLSGYWGPTGIVSSELEDAMKAMEELQLKIAIARCARVSYDNFDGSQDYEKDLQLFDKLFSSSPIHASPAEHVARTMTDEEYYSHVKGVMRTSKDNYGIYNHKYYSFIYDDKINGPNPHNDASFGWCRNFRGFIQYRTLLPNDTIYNDPRLNKH